MEPKERAEKLLKFLEDNKNNNTIMANLKRGMAEMTEHYSWPYLAKMCNIQNKRQRVIYSTVSACFALHPENGTTPIIKAMAGIRIESIEKRFKQIIDLDVIGVCDRIKSFVRIIKSESIPISYEELLIDLWYWGDISRLKWAQQFWGK